MLPAQPPKCICDNVCSQDKLNITHRFALLHHRLFSATHSVSWSQNLLLREVVFILVLNAQVCQQVKLVLLDSLDLQTVILEFLPDLAAFLKVVKSLLLFDFIILRDLLSNLAKHFKSLN